MVDNISMEFVWLIVGILFLFSEIFIPGLVIAFFGVGALVTALTTWPGFTNSIQLQIIVFVSSSIIMLAVLRRFVKNIFAGRARKENDQTAFNLEVGKIVSVTELIEPGEVGGKVRNQGVQWSAKSNSRLIPGESVKIVGCDNITLIVEKISEEQ